MGDDEIREHMTEKGKSPTTVGHRIMDVATADSRRFPIRKIADLVMVVAACLIFVLHADHEHGHREAWILLAFGGGDLGIQGIGGILKLVTRR